MITKNKAIRWLTQGVLGKIREILTVSIMSESVLFLSVEGEFTHLKACEAARKLDKEELIDIFETVHKQYLIRDNLFRKMLKFCTSQGVMLPPIDELLRST